MIPTNLIFSSQTGLPQGLGETPVVGEAALQLSDFSEINFAKFFLAQFQQAQAGTTRPIQPGEQVAEEGSELPLLPAIVAAEQPLEEALPETTPTVSIPVLLAGQQTELRKQSEPLALAPDSAEELPPILNKVVLQGNTEHKEVQLFSKEQQPLVSGEKLIVESTVENKPVLLPQFSPEKTDLLKAVDNKPTPILDKQPTNNITALEPLHTRPLIPLSSSPTPGSPVQLTLDAPFAQAKWSESLAGRVVWMAAENHSTAKITINPPELGPIEVRLSVNNDQTNVNFIAQHSSVRDAIEDAFPRLRDMFSQNGINLGDTNVSDQSTANKGNEQSESVVDYNANYSNDVEEEFESGQADRVLRGTGLVDHFV